ncbi:MAG: DUF1059 domain-containing protein [Caldilineaceae bacterium]
MKWEITGRELGVQDCDYTASGDEVDDVLHQIVDHLRMEHGIDMPDVDVILEAKATDDPLGEPDADVSLIVRRLVEALNIEPPQAPEEPDSLIPPVAVNAYRRP